MRTNLTRYFLVPTRVGVNRFTASRAAAAKPCPHARGGEPRVAVSVASATYLSPRAWG